MAKRKKTSNPFDDSIDALDDLRPGERWTRNMGIDRYTGRLFPPRPSERLSQRDRRVNGLLFLFASALAAGGTVIAYKTGASFELIIPGAIAAFFGFAAVMTYRSGRNKSSSNQGGGR